MDVPHSLHGFQPSPVAVSQMPPYPAQHPPSQTPTHTQAPQQPLSPQSAWQAQQDSIDRARQYKSRNKRPCDFCRYKKAACHLENQPPCELCIRYNKECTFVESPAKRRRPNNSISHGDHIKSDGSDERRMSLSGPHVGPTQPQYSNNLMGNGMEMHHNMPLWENTMQQFPMQHMEISPGIPPPNFGAFDPAIYHDSSIPFDGFDSVSNNTPNLENLRQQTASAQKHRNSVDASSASQTPHLPSALNLPFERTSGEPSLDNQVSSNAQIVGTGSGEADPYLMSRYRYDAYNEAAFQSIRFRRMVDGSKNPNSIPTYFTIAHNALASKAQPPEKQEIQDDLRREVEEMVNDDVGKRLIRLFYTYVQPYCPVLTRSGPHERDVNGVRLPASVPTPILAAIYGHALPFCTWDEELCVDVYTPPSADALFKIAWQACLPKLHTPSLSVLQTLLLLVQRRPTNKHVSDTPFKWTMMTTAVSIAQALGLNRDPSGWPIPSWEIKTRRRLGWATFIQDKWLALNFGRSSHIQADDWDVSPLTSDDFADADFHRDGAELRYGEHFIKLCELTLIVDDIMHDLFSLRATRALHNSLEATLEVAKPLRIRLTDWHRSVPPELLPQSTSTSPDTATRRATQQELDGNGSLQLAYITAKIELFRAMLRPRVTDTNATAVSALRNGAIAVAQEVLEFLEALNAKELEAFWAGYARSNFTIASSFMLLLFATSPNLTDATQCLMILNAWRSLLRIKSRSCNLLNLSLLRLDGVYVAGIEKLIELSPSAAQAWAESGQAK